MKKHLKEVVKYGSIYVFGSISQKILAFVLIPIYTTFLTTADYGIIALMSITVELIAPCIATPLVTGFARHYYNPEWKGKRKETFFNSLLFATVQAGSLAVIFYCASQYISRTLLGDAGLHNVVKVYAVILFLSPLKQLLQALVRIQKKATLYVVLNISRLLISAVVILYLLIGRKLGIMALVYGNLIIAGYDVLFLFPYLLKNIKAKYDLPMLKPLLKFGYPLILSTIGVVLLNAGDRYVLRLLRDVKTVGLYDFGYKFGMLMSVLLIKPAGTILTPVIYSLEEKKEEVKIFVFKISKYFSIVSAFVFLVLSVFAKEYIQLLARREEFWGAWVVVPFILLAYVQKGLGFFSSQGIWMSKKTIYESYSFMICVGTNMLLNFALIPVMGIFGAALATCISYGLLNVIFAYYSAKFYKMYLPYKEIATISFIGIILYAVTVPLNYINMYVALTMKLLVLILFVLIIYKSALIGDKEKIFVKQVFKRAKKKGIVYTIRNLALQVLKT